MMDLARFESASLRHREADVDVPELAEFFGEEKPVWKVRGLSAVELGRAKMAGQRTEAVAALVQAAAGKGDKAEAMRKVLGIADGEVPPDVSYRIDVLAEGSVEPKLGQEKRDVVVRLAEMYPVTFYSLTTKILELTGEGAEVGKPPRSGQSPNSDT